MENAYINGKDILIRDPAERVAAIKSIVFKQAEIGWFLDEDERQAEYRVYPWSALTAGSIYDTGTDFDRVAHVEQKYAGRNAAHDVLDIPIYTLFDDGGKWHIKARLGSAIAIQLQILYDSLAFFHTETASIISHIRSRNSLLSEHQAIDILDELWRNFMFTYRLSRTLRGSARHNWCNINIQRLKESGNYYD